MVAEGYSRGSRAHCSSCSEQHGGGGSAPTDAGPQPGGGGIAPPDADPPQCTPQVPDPVIPEEPPGCVPQGAPERGWKLLQHFLGRNWVRFALRVSKWVPNGIACYLAAALTAAIIGGGFTFAAPIVFPPLGTPGGNFWYAFSVWLTMVVITNFYLGVTTSPEPDDVELAEAAAAGAPLCEPCGKPKPHRAHHCRHCGRCAAEMDHHCIFLNNCVGSQNQRFFMRFVAAVCVSCLYVALAVTGPAMVKIGAFDGRRLGFFGTPQGMRAAVAAAIAFPTALFPAGVPVLGYKRAAALTFSLAPCVAVVLVAAFAGLGLIELPARAFGAAVMLVPPLAVLSQRFEVQYVAITLGFAISALFSSVVLVGVAAVHSNLAITLAGLFIASLVVAALTALLLFYHMLGVYNGVTQFELMFKIKLAVPPHQRRWSNLFRLLTPPGAEGWWGRHGWLLAALAPFPLPPDRRRRAKPAKTD